MTNLSIIIKDEWSLYRYRDYLYKYFNKNFNLQKLFLYVSENETKGNYIKTLSRINSYFFKNIFRFKKILKNFKKNSHKNFKLNKKKVNKKIPKKNNFLRGKKFFRGNLFSGIVF